MANTESKSSTSRKGTFKLLLDEKVMPLTFS